MYVVYVLYSTKHNKIYGGCRSNLEERLLSHNKLGKKGWTINYRPWTLVYSEQYGTKELAMNRERELKFARGRAGFGLKLLRNSIIKGIFVGLISA